jgi:hypothetical protein
VVRVGRWAVLACAIWAGCSSVRLELFAPEDDASLGDAQVNDLDASLDAELDAGEAGLDAARLGLILRYDFTGVGNELRNRVGDASAVIRGGALLNDSGVLALDGVDDYVDLPNRTLASLQNATLISWVSWSGGVCWQRVFDFGFNDLPEGQEGFGRASLFLTFSTCPEGKLAARSELPGAQRVFTAMSDASLPSDRAMQLAVVYDADRSRMRLYLDGTPMADTQTDIPLSALQDVNAWLGRSQWSQDDFTRARFDEFRIYDRALTDQEIRDTFTRGPNAP